MAEEHHKQIAELQQRFLDTQRQLVTVETQLQLLQREKKKSELTLKELNDLPSGVRTYRPVGKMFLMATMRELTKELQSKITTAESDITHFVNSRQYLERQMREIGNGMKELTK
mmetsp:Transcript_15226/g.25090  ORF Transcript_15226/g.25090 Transcript_15226/m.25090 type:complete len:114 (+) Transcript_15226:50-391(+)